jgi:sugar/nucleoside kinase (ribokinase family)
VNTPELRKQCADQLLAHTQRVANMSAFVGLDGFVDEIVHVVDKRENAETFSRLPTIDLLAKRLAGAAGKSTNIEFVTALTKLGGNGPIMANALASFGLKVTYLGNLGYPNLHPIFSDFAKRAEVHSIAEPGYTDAMEFDDGKVMLGKHSSLKEVNWANISARFGKDNFSKHFGTADLVGFVNWTMLPYMSNIWESIQKEISPTLKGPRRKIFFDLADPEKRTADDIRRALKLIGNFETHFDVILGLNEKEAYEVGNCFGLKPNSATPECLAELTRKLAEKLQISTLVVHPVTYALAVSKGVVNVVEGPFVQKPLITTGAGDHFNSGFCLGKLLGFSNEMSVLTGVTTSGFYVRTAKSPTVIELAGFLNEWPTKN